MFAEDDMRMVLFKFPLNKRFENLCNKVPCSLENKKKKIKARIQSRDWLHVYISSNLNAIISDKLKTLKSLVTDA